MRLKAVAFAFAVALLMFMGFALSDSGEKAEASIDPIVESECAKSDSQSGNSGNGTRTDTAGNDQHPPGQTPGDGPGDGKGDLKGVRSSDDNAKNGQGTDNCKNP